MLQPLGAIAANPHYQPSVPVVFVDFETPHAAAAAKDKLENGYAASSTPRELTVGYGIRSTTKRGKRMEDEHNRAGNPNEVCMWGAGVLG